MKTVVIKNGRVLDPSCRTFMSADILLCDGKFNVSRVLAAGRFVPLTGQIFTAE